MNLKLTMVFPIKRMKITARHFFIRITFYIFFHFSGGNDNTFRNVWVNINKMKDFVMIFFTLHFYYKYLKKMLKVNLNSRAQPETFMLRQWLFLG